MALARKLGIAALIIYTLVVTVLRAFRSPNDFAEAHWLLDYRFGFVKRGLIGEILSLTTEGLSIPIAERLIATLSSVAFVIYCVAITLLSLRIIQRSGWSTGGVLAALVFLSSPFMVMSAHLIGYYDNIVIVLGIAAVVLLLQDKPWLGAGLLILAILSHENTLLLVFAPFCLAWLLINSRRQKVDVPNLPFLPLLLPVCAFLTLAINQEIFLTKDFRELAMAHLTQFPFVYEGYRFYVPHSFSTSFLVYFTYQAPYFFERILAIDLHGLILPSTLAILFSTVTAYRIRDLSLESLLLLGVSFTPQLMHLVAHDTPRIWTYTILCAFLALWIYAEVFTAHEASAASRLLCLAALVANTVILTPLMDALADQFSLTTRLLLYAPVIVGSLALMLFEERIALAERLSIQGVGISKLLSPTKRSDAARAVPGAEPEVDRNADVTPSVSS